MSLLDCPHTSASSRYLGLLFLTSGACTVERIFRPGISSCDCVLGGPLFALSWIVDYQTSACKKFPPGHLVTLGPRPGLFSHGWTRTIIVPYDSAPLSLALELATSSAQSTIQSWLGCILYSQHLFPWTADTHFG
jgi:hypothetical protein